MTHKKNNPKAEVLFAQLKEREERLATMDNQTLLR